MNPSRCDNAKPSVLVTRPTHQATRFIQRLEDEGFTVVPLPSIDVNFIEVDLTETLQTDLIIFTSANAVTGAHRNLPLPWQGTAKIAAIGKATANALQQHNCPVNIVPHKAASTEALLESLIKELGNPHGLKITIVRGDSGREALFNKLKNLGAEPVYQAVYERKQPAYTEAHLRKIFEQGLPDIISVTSDLGFCNLLKIIPVSHHQTLFTKPLIVNSDRCAELAASKGFHAEILVAEPPGDDSQVDILINLR